MPDLHLYHITHSCGHSVWWSNATAAIFTASYPCPWCGGSKGNKSPEDEGDKIIDFKPASVGTARKRLDQRMTSEADIGRNIGHHNRYCSCDEVGLDTKVN